MQENRNFGIKTIRPAEAVSVFRWCEADTKVKFIRLDVSDARSKLKIFVDLYKIKYVLAFLTEVGNTRKENIVIVCLFIILQILQFW